MTTRNEFPLFFDAYLAAALWSSIIDEGEQQDGRNGDFFDAHFSISEFSEEALQTLRAHAFSFWSRMWFYLDHEEGRKGEKPDSTKAGHDFWLTQNGHGAGFWDGDYPTYGETFTKLAKCYPEINLFVTEENEVGVE